MNKGITNLEINKFFENEENQDIKNNYMGVYSMDSITRYINFYEIIKKRNGKYPFAIFNTGKHNKPGTHWWSFMDIHPPKNLLLFDSLGLEGFKFFTVDNDENIIDELLYNFKKCKVSLVNQKLTLCTMKFSINVSEKLPHTKKEQLTDTAQTFFHLLAQFVKLKRTNDMNILIVEHPVQELTSSTCGLFQLYFYKNIFDPEEKSKIINHGTLNKRMIEAILNEVLTTDANENEQVIGKFKEEYDL